MILYVVLSTLWLYEILTQRRFTADLFFFNLNQQPGKIGHFLCLQKPDFMFPAFFFAFNWLILPEHKSAVGLFCSVLLCLCQ